MNNQPDLSPVKVLALARLLAAGEKGETEKILSKDLLPLVEHRWAGQVWADRLGTALDELESAGAFSRIKKGKTTRLALTDTGRQIALKALGIEEPPAKPTWAEFKSTCLAALALNRPGQPVANLKLEILRSRYDLDLSDDELKGRPATGKLAAKLAAKLLGLEPGNPFSVDNILQKLLLDAGIAIRPGRTSKLTRIQEALFRRELGGSLASNPLDLLATHNVGARKATPAELVAAVLRTWVDRSEVAEPVDVLSTPPEKSAYYPAPLDLADFARRVVEAARTSPTGWFGDAKVFISHVWHALRDDPAFGGMAPASFKDRLLEAHRAHYLELGRADLVEAMDPVDVRESATPYQNVVYHFVRTEEPAR